MALICLTMALLIPLDHEFSCGETVSNACRTEDKKEDRNEPFEEQGAHKGMSIFGKGCP